MRADDLDLATLEELKAARKQVGEVVRERIDRLIATREIEDAYDREDTEGIDVEELSGFQLADVPDDAIRFDWIPVSKNDLRQPVIHNRTGKPMIVKPERAQKWERYAKRVTRAAWDTIPLTGPVRVLHWLAFADRRRRDGPNPSELLYDALQGVCYRDDVQIVDWRGRKAVAPELDDHIMWVKIEEVNLG